jgi:hypothetical protein
MSLPLQVIEGIFSEHSGAIMVSRAEGGDVDISGLLTGLLGKSVEISIHHFPFDLDNTLPGGGSCLWHGFCPHGHREHPAWLFQQQLSGALSFSPPGRWHVGGTLLDLSKMPGHQGRLVVLDAGALLEPEPDDTRSPDDLVQEAGALIQLLQGLQKAVKP